MKFEVRVIDVINAYRTLMSLARDKKIEKVKALRIAQNLRAIEMEVKVIDAQREQIRIDHPGVEKVKVDNQQMIEARPEGWNADDPESNSDELKQQRQELWDAYNSEILEHNEADIEVHAIGFRVRHLPDDMFVFDAMNILWMIADIENLDLNGGENEPSE